MSVSNSEKKNLTKEKKEINGYWRKTIILLLQQNPKRVQLQWKPLLTHVSVDWLLTG